MDTRYKIPGGERCQNCGRIYKICWKAPDDVWERITGGAPGESSGGLLCPNCFDALCAANGISLFWECKLDGEHWKEYCLCPPDEKEPHPEYKGLCAACGKPILKR